FRSAWIPAPPPLSLPAIVSAIGMAVMGSLLSGGNVAHVGGKAIGRAPWGDAAVLYRALAYQRPETRYSAGGRWSRASRALKVLYAELFVCSRLSCEDGMRSSRAFVFAMRSCVVGCVENHVSTLLGERRCCASSSSKKVSSPRGLMPAPMSIGIATASASSS